MSPVQSTVAHVDSTVEPAQEQEGLAKSDDTVSGASPPRDEEGPSTADASAAKSAAEDDATEDDATDETTTMPNRAALKRWTEYKRQMDRLDTAVKRAIAVVDSEAADKSADDTTEKKAKSITMAFDDSQSYRIPWDACRTWQCVVVFLREWFADDDVALKAIGEGNFAMKFTYGDVIHPKLWESVVQPDSDVEFSQQLPPEVVAPPAQTADDDDAPEISFEKRVSYKVSYYQRGQYDGRSYLVSENVYTEPVELEVTHEDDKIPVLEERKNVERPPNPLALGRANEVNSKKANLQKPRLRQEDMVSQPLLKINSPYLLNILKAVIVCSAEPPSGDKGGLNAGLFTYPYRDLYLHLDDLLEYKNGTDLRKLHSDAFNKLADEHIDVLQSYLENQPAVQYKEAKARWTVSNPLTTFGTFWLCMKPATDVYVREFDGTLSRYVLDRLIGGIFQNERGKKETTKYTAQVWNMVLDDKCIRQYRRHVEIQVFDDERNITQLPVFPAHFIDKYDDGAQYQTLVDRGKKYFDYSKSPCFLQYTGQGLRPGSRSYKRARVVVEHATKPWIDDDIWGPDLEHHMPAEADPDDTPSPPVLHPFLFAFNIPPPPLTLPSTIGESIRVARCECKECEAQAHSKYLRLKFSEYREIDPNKTPPLTDHQRSILPSHMFAFILKDRVYDLLDVAQLMQPNMADTAIDRLVMDPDNKDLIKAIAKIYTDNAQRFSADFIYGKGEGQIILLHGPPGTGKTLTAESVAEFTRRPLLSITAADLGHEADALEKSLLQYFRRANDWDAIVLLDEADVYLEERSSSDLQRNSIVSVFLRALDYFQGILFLTTNRVGQFDEAFMSRIHLSLGYDKLSDDARGQIWENLFQKLQEDFESNDGPEIRYDYYAKEYVTKNAEVTILKWNGREIRNAFQTAVALAVYDAKHRGKGPVPKVTEQHLKQVVSMSSAFKKYIKATHNDKELSDRSFERGNRDDRASITPKK